MVVYAKYTGLITCKICGKNFKSKRERNTQKYVCAGYDRYGKEYCERKIIKEQLLDELVELHFREKVSFDLVRNYVGKVDIFEDKLIITYMDGSQTIRSRNFLQI
jgi:hypothetical protein